MEIAGLIIDHIGPCHEDNRRAIIEVFNNVPNSDLSGFSAQQLKIAEIHRDLPLGGHYHDYRELFYLLRGVAEFTVEDINTKQRLSFGLSKGGRVLIPAEVAHRVDKIRSDSILIGCTEEPYISGEVNDKKYSFE